MFSPGSALYTSIFISNLLCWKNDMVLIKKGRFIIFFVLFCFVIFPLHFFFLFASIECSGRKGKQNCSGAMCVYRLRQIKGAVNHFASWATEGWMSAQGNLWVFSLIKLPHVHCYLRALKWSNNNEKALQSCPAQIHGLTQVVNVVPHLTAPDPS